MDSMNKELRRWFVVVGSFVCFGFLVFSSELAFPRDAVDSTAENVRHD